MKKILSLLLATVMLLAVIPFSASAAADLDGAYEALLAGVYDFSNYIDIEEYDLDIQQLHELVDKLVKNEPMLFHISGGYRYYYYDDAGNYPIAVEFDYIYSKSEYKDACEYVDDEVEMILSLIPEGLSELETALFLHDYICVNFEYDLTYQIYDIYNFVLYDTGVCMAYSLLYDELLTRIGIESSAVLSPEYSINHMWNEIKLDGKWYHVDCTWDDPTPDRFSYCGHRYYLICDDCAYTQHENCVYFADYDCNDKTYEGLEWRWIDTPFAFVNDKIYGLDENTIVEIELTSDTPTVIERVLDSGWESSDGSTYLGYLSGFGGYKNLLFYNTEDAIFAYDPITGNKRAVLEIDSGSIIGLYMNGKQINYCVSSTGYYDDGVKYVYNLTDSDLVFDSTPDPDPDPDPDP
ncbi:MAG: hypothetical protein IKT34_03545, partial [Clostridia bacterium]|nr:hypothetical protein [Clostridia bacterium]